MELKKHKFLSLLLAAALLLTAFPATASATNVDEHSYTESVMDLVYDVADDATVIELPITSGTVGESSVLWDFDASGGRLTIGGSGGCDTFRSSDDQPWVAFRDEITEVWFSDMSSLAIENLAYWFEGCINLTSAEIPYTTSIVGENAFWDCARLEKLFVYYVDDDMYHFSDHWICPNGMDGLTVYYDTTQKEVFKDLLGALGRATFRDVYTLVYLGCSECGSSIDVSVQSDGDCCYSWYSCTNPACGYETWGIVLGDHSSLSCTSRCNYCGATGSCSYRWSGCWYGCSDCGRGSWYCNYAYGSYTYHSQTQHKRWYGCTDCGDGYYQYTNHSSAISYSSVDGSNHKITDYCSTCKTTVSSNIASHTLAYGAWSCYSETQHRRTVSCSECGYSGFGYTDHADGNGDGYCDACAYEMTRFSVTVPTSLALTVSKSGKVYAPTNAAIVNNSTGNVAVTGITVTTANGWRLVPYDYNMAAAKVNSKLIGFSVNGAKTTKSGNGEALTLPGNWQIAKGASLSLKYDAVVSATSVPINQQVLTIVFVVDWV